MHGFPDTVAVGLDNFSYKTVLDLLIQLIKILCGVRFRRSVNGLGR